MDFVQARFRTAWTEKRHIDARRKRESRFPCLYWTFPVAGMRRYKLKVYFEFDNDERPAGWNTWLIFSILPPAPPAATPSPVADTNDPQ